MDELGDDQRSSNLPFQHVSRAAATNDGTLSAIVNKSVRSVDVPLGNATPHQHDEMLFWLHYPVADSIDRGYCSDIFGDLPSSSAQLVRHSFNEPGLRPPSAHLSIGSPLFGGTPLHGTSTSVNTCTTVSESARDTVESCGSGSVEPSFRVAGADAVLGLGVCQAAGVILTRVGLEGYGKLDTGVDVLRREKHAERLACNSSSGNETLHTQSESCQTLSQASSQQEGSLSSMNGLSCVPKPLDVMNYYTNPVPPGKHGATNFELFSRPVAESKVNLHVVGESSGPTNIERVRQQTVQHGMFQESTSTCTTPLNLAAVQVKRLPPPVPLRPLLPLPRPIPPLLPSCSSFSVSLERSPLMYARVSPVLPLPQSFAGESGDETNVCKDTSTCSRMSVMSTEKGTRTADQSATSPSRCSGSSTEKRGKMMENASSKQKLAACEDSDYQSEYVEEMATADKKSPSIAKRLRTAEMHNQSERKRRVKINDKLKTLQQLIPNGNKPDKASLLDAVIEYIKLLQSQLQVISMRTGIGIPSGIMPNANVQHLQMPSFTHMRLTTDIGMGMRMGVGMMDANVAAVGTGCTIMPMPLFPPPPIPQSAGLQAADRMQSLGMMNLHVGPSHVQYPLMNQNIPIYNTAGQCCKETLLLRWEHTDICKLLFYSHCKEQGQA
ncbi:hypothetical protein GOP47_0012381 [Adiantum capillus-veneris]|uniref:BHLH domain-containing protein n=1 Tax=Adiantum capillus-veneris TaxID=13818 RepID=A0A9D4UQW7_ADICA|nr:hypothetical protein GOP47_0012381 [Adiantum capillus-veneris]